METQAIAKKKPLTRFGEFELMKAIAILGLPAVHLMEEAISGELATDGLLWLQSLIVGLCIIGPSVFMICMGFGLGGSATPPKKILKNGLRFLFIAMLLNVCRWLLPGIMQLIVMNDPLKDDVLLFLQSDIYCFVGFFYVFYALMRMCKVKSFGLLLISILMLTANTLLTPITSTYVTNEYVYSIVGHFTYVNNTSCFPLLSWAIFPSVGIFLGEILKKKDDVQRETFMRRILDFSAVVLVSFTVFLAFYGVDLEKVYVSPLNDYITDLPNAILLISLALCCFSGAYYLCKLIGASKFMAFMIKISTFVVPFYLLQWLLVSWAVYIMELFPSLEHGFGVLPYVIGTAAITAVCIYFATKHGMKFMKLLSKLTSFKKRGKKTVKA